MLKSVSIAVVAATMFGLTAAAHAAPPGLTQMPLTALADAMPVHQTHGWHRSCRRGLNGWHRHVRGVGRIQCTTRRCSRNQYGRMVCRYF
jgi:hypothetical protein